MSTINFPINVGINQPNPQYNLDVSGSINSMGYFVNTIISGSGSNNSEVIDASGNGYLKNVSASALFINNAATTVGSSYPVYMGIKSSTGATVYSVATDAAGFTRIYSGPTGASTGSANKVEDKNSPNADNYYGENTDLGGYYFRGQGVFSFGNQSSPAIYTVGSNNKVGINNINPQYTLDVAGNVNAYNISSTIINCLAITASLMGTASAVVGPVNATIFQFPYSSSAHIVNVNYATASAYFQTVTTASGSNNLLFVFNGTRWTSASLA